MNMEIQHTKQNLREAAKIVLGRKFYSSKHLHQKTRKISNNLILHRKELEKEEISPNLAEGRK